MALILACFSFYIAHRSRSRSSIHVYATIDFNVYVDPECTIPATEIDWENCSVGDTYNNVLYMFNNQNSSITVSMNTTGWSPASARDYITQFYVINSQYTNTTEMLPYSNQSINIWLNIDLNISDDPAFPANTTTPFSFDTNFFVEGGLDSSSIGVVGELGIYGYAAVEYAVQRKTFYANGRFWVFYFNGTNRAVYRTSIDGLDWSSFESMTDRTCGAGWRFAVTFNGTYLSYALSTSMNNDPLYYRVGTPNSDGTITWLDAEQNVTTGESNTQHLWPAVAIDSDGYPWVAYARKNVTENTRYPYITKSSINNGTWATASGFPHQLSSENYTCINVLVVSLTNQKVLAIASNASSPIKSFRWDGSSWGTQQNTTSSIGDVSIYLSAVNQGNDVHLVFLKNGTQDLIYTKYDYNTDSWGTETTVQSAVTNTSSPVLSIDTSTNDLYCFWAGSPEAEAIYYKKYNGTDWAFTLDSNPWITEGALAGYYHYDGLSGFYQRYNNTIGLAYTNGTTTYFVKFKYLELSAGTVTLTITYPANTTYTVPTVPVQLSASGGTIDKIWWNCTFTNSTVVYANQTYTVSTSMTLGNGSYIFNAMANNTDGNESVETVMFSVSVIGGTSSIIVNVWWSGWW